MKFDYYNPLLTEQHHNYRQTIREFAEAVIQPNIQYLDANSEFSVENTRAMAKLGLMGIQAPKEYGGQALDTLSYIIAVEELSRIDGSHAVTIAAHNSLGISPIVKFGTPKQKETYLPDLTSTGRLWAFGLTEPTAGSDANNTKTTAVKDGDHWVINGEKIFITNASSELAAGVTIQAVTGEKENGKKQLTAILVPTGTPGYTSEAITNKMLWKAADTAKLTFQNCRVPIENQLGQEGKGTNLMMESLDSGRLSIGAMGLGLAQGAFEMAHQYAQERMQFGRPISKFQAVSFKLADMAMKIELARNTLYKACWQKDQKLPFGKEAAMAKLYCSEVARDVADEAVQIHGAYGIITDNAVERFYRDQRILQIGEGTSEILRLVIARHIGIK